MSEVEREVRASMKPSKPWRVGGDLEDGREITFHDSRGIKMCTLMLIVVSMIAFLASCRLLDCTRQITETDTDTETESATVGTAEAVVWLYFPDLAGKPYESIVLMGDDLDKALRYLNGIELKDANRQPEEPLTEMYVAVDAVRGYTMTYIVDSIGQVWVYIDEDCLWVGVHQRGRRWKGVASASKLFRIPQEDLVSRTLTPEKVAA